MPRLVALAVLLLVLASTAGAATVRGTARGDRLVGTPRADLLFGLAGTDTIHGLAGGDFVDPGPGRDVVHSGGGPDSISLETDGRPDRVLCGPGRDIVTADESDSVGGADCEVVSRRISRDTLRGGPAQHATEVEPDSHAWGSTIVSVFQVGRIFDGGAQDIGFATSVGGRLWRPGRLPGVSAGSSPPGRAARVSDPVVSYDAERGVWLAVTLGVSPRLTQLLVSRSTDGLRWDLPVVAASSTSPSLAYDKVWLACDSWPASPFRGRCYLAYTDVASHDIVVQVSGDGGLTWSSPRPVPEDREQSVAGAQPVVRPDGTVVVVFVLGEAIAASRSTNGGGSFEIATTVAQRPFRPVTGMRAPVLPSADVAPDGTLYVAWHGCGFRPDCRANDVVLSSSPDGVRWTSPRRLPVAGAMTRTDLFLPALAVSPLAERFHELAVAYYLMRDARCELSACRVDVWAARSFDGGVTWAARRVNARTMRLEWIANTNQRRMLADYISVSFADGLPVPVFSLASPPQAGSFRQAIYAARVP
ncbi:MAG: exo-alpha-sialidase [Gaiellaceae bacterium]